MKKENGITLVALVVTIIVLIILAGISINLILGDNGIITIAKMAKENTELAQTEEENKLNELYTQLETNASSSDGTTYDAIAKLTEFKTAIAKAIDEAGGVKPDVSAETTVFADNIKGLLKEATKNATATADDIAEGKTAYVNGELILGTGTNNIEKIRFTTPDETHNTISVDTKINGLVLNQNMFVSLNYIALYSSGSNGWVGIYPHVTVSGTVVTITIEARQAKSGGTFDGYIYIIK